MPISFSQRKPISEGAELKLVQNAGGHAHEFVKDEIQAHPTLTSYACKKCGYGLMIDETIDSLDNHK